MKNKNNTLLHSGVNIVSRRVRKAQNQIQEFFDQYSSSESLGLLFSACRAAESNYIWDYHSPSELLHFTQSLKVLLSVVFGLKEKELRLLGQLNGGSGKDKYFQAKPRYLSSDETADPAFTLFKYSKVNRLTDLKAKLDLILEFALTKNSIVASGNDLAILTTAELLAKLLEACALLTYTNQD